MNSDTHPSDLTVVIPAFRAEQTIRRAVKSAFAAGAATVIVVDDGSDDATGEHATDVGATCIRQENAGAAKARATGAEHATGTYLIFLDADDELIPSAVRNSVRILEENPSLAVSAGTVIGVAEGGVERPFPVRYSPVTTNSLLTNGFGPWPPCAAVVRRAAYAASKSIEPAALAPRYAEDYELLIRLSMVGDIAVRDEPSCRYSLAGGKSVRSASSAIEAKEDIRRHYADHFGLDIEYMSDRRVRMAASARRARAEWASGNLLSAALRLGEWVLADPVHAGRKLLTKPWNRN
ncbi:glycosyltransferase family 2 protein [Prescottella subtropica]|uniref:glycosyltransferase family 2 protein n=1 Tax=Prescottella subtropica TaxID=2545757 RepID=UPI0010FA4197|nr:glycosyltransferase family A protein [Prescottella subtropica]